MPTRRTVAPRTVLIVACLGVFMAFLDNTIVTIAFPNMLKSFPRSSLESLSWVFNVYNIALGALLVPAGRIVDLAGRRRLFSAGIVIFTVASILCAVAPSVGVLVAARGLQGAGAAIIIPASLGLILHAYSGPRRHQAVAIWSGTGALAAGIGPSIGGLLVVLSSWRLVFLINVPVGIVVWRLAGRQLVESRAPGRRSVPDLAGALMLATSVGLLSLAIVQGQVWRWTNARTLAAIVCAAATGAWFIRRCRLHESPIIDLELLRSRGFAVTGVLTLIGGAGFFALGLANILYLIQIWGYSPLLAGLAGTPAPFLAALAAALAGKLVARRDPRPFIVVGAALWATGPLILLSSFSLTPHYLTGYLPGAAVLAIGIGVCFPLVSGIAVAGAPGGRFAGATALNSAIRQVGAALGVAILVALVGHPSAAQAKGAFERAWLFSAACFAVVAVGALALGRTTAVVPADDLEAGGEDDRIRTQTPVPTTRGASAREELPVFAGPRAYSSVADILGTVPMFAALLAETREALAERASVVRIASGKWLFRQGEHADALYLVRSGRLEVVDETPGQEPTVVRELTTGSALGELALICASQRTASVRVRRDARLLRIGRDDFEAILEGSPAFSRAMLRTLGEWLSTGRVGATTARRTPKTIAVVAMEAAALAARIDDALLAKFDELASVVRLTPSAVAGADDVGLALSELLDRVETDTDHVILAGGAIGDEDPWTDACVRQADRVVLVLDAVPSADHRRGWPLPTGCDVILLGPPVDAAARELLDELRPRVTYRVRAGARRDEDVAVVARRLSGRSVGLVLSGGGARCFTHIGVIEELHESGVRIDRIGGTSMGAFIGALLAQDMSPEEIDARCYQEWVRRNPGTDYCLPRTSLIRGRRIRAMLERNLPGSIEDLVRGFFCVSVDLITAQPVRHGRGRLAECVAASMALPALLPPVVLDGRLLVDGGLMDNLPTEAMAADGDGPIIAVDVSEPSVRSLPDGLDPAVPSLPETLFKVMLLSESDDTRRQSFADVVIRPDFGGVGILEFHMLDEMRAAGRRAAAAALADLPASVLG